MPMIYLIGQKQRNYAAQALAMAPDDAVVSITKPTRSPPQNKKMWAMLRDISQSKPDGRTHTPDTWKALMMKACGHEVQFVLGIDGEPFPAGFRSSHLSKSQMSDLIEFAYEYGSRHGVEWREATRSGFMEPQDD